MRISQLPHNHTLLLRPCLKRNKPLAASLGQLPNKIVGAAQPIDVALRERVSLAIPSQAAQAPSSRMRPHSGARARQRPERSDDDD